MMNRIVATVVVLGMLTGCTSGPPQLPYPAFLQVDAFSDVVMATVPGVRAKQLAGDPQTRRTSNRIDLPRDWKGTSGGAPGRSMELFVLQGKLQVADIELRRGGYAFLPAGSLGFNLSAKEGARVLYFLNDADPESVIRSPIIIDSSLLAWERGSSDGVLTKVLREDPGNGAKTWISKVVAGATLPWETSTAIREGYLMQGGYQHSECVNGVVHTWQYLPGGYFYRPADTINGGPESLASTDSVWFLRETDRGETALWPDCMVPPEAPAGQQPTPAVDEGGWE